MIHPHPRRSGLRSKLFRSWLAWLARARFRTIRCAIRHFRQPRDIFRILWTSSVRIVTVELRSGLKICMRLSLGRSNTDLTVLAENLFQDQYRLKNMARENMVVVDIGAHVGIFAIVCASQCRNACVYSFEPEGSNYELLEKNVRLNPELCIRPSNMAVTGTGDPVKLYLSEHNSGAHSTFGVGGIFQEVESTTLGAILAELPGHRIDLLKIDCEGNEYGILMNAHDDVLGRIDRIVMETHHGSHTPDRDWETLYRRLRDSGFAVKILDSGYTENGVTHLVSAVRI